MEVKDPESFGLLETIRDVLTQVLVLRLQTRESARSGRKDSAGSDASAPQPPGRERAAAWHPRPPAGGAALNCCLVRESENKTHSRSGKHPEEPGGFLFASTLQLGTSAAVRLPGSSGGVRPY